MSEKDVPPCDCGRDATAYMQAGEEWLFLCDECQASHREAVKG